MNEKPQTPPFFRMHQHGERVEGLLAYLQSVEMAFQKNGKPYLKLSLRDNGGVFTVCIWNEPQIFETRLQGTTLVRVTGTVEVNRFGYSLTPFDAIDPVHEKDCPDLDRVLPDLPSDHAALCQRLSALIKSVDDKPYQELLHSFFEERVYTRFIEAPAGLKLHHAYRGGLLRHTLEVATLCNLACLVYPSLDRNLLITAALLHDVAKIVEREFTRFGTGNLTRRGKLLGHINDGLRLIVRKSCKIDGFTLEREENLCHLILSHHEEPEHGSSVRPQLAEAVVLTKCDQLSAHLAPFLEAQTYEPLPDLSSLLPLMAPQVPTTSPTNSFVPARPEVITDNLSEPTKRPSLPLPLPKIQETPFTTYATSTGSTIRLPICGLVAAGDGERSSEAVDEWCEVTLPKGGADYLLRVTGDSMSDAGILHGDLLFVRRQETAPLGKIVVAHVPLSGQVVKRLQEEENGQRVLASENRLKQYPALPVTADVTLQGVITGVWREF